MDRLLRILLKYVVLVLRVQGDNQNLAIFYTSTWYETLRKKNHKEKAQMLKSFNLNGAKFVNSNQMSPKNQVSSPNQLMSEERKFTPQIKPLMGLKPSEEENRTNFTVSSKSLVTYEDSHQSVA